ncbi:hypothetical protein HDU93_006097 [Gonapodya sp. JEL0774]|nr:hypothetical protein HDU93_006097 [Gonapodya sp. JEL0774]
MKYPPTSPFDRHMRARIVSCRSDSRYGSSSNDQIYRTADELGALNVHVYERGDQLNWHFDRGEYAVTVLLQPCISGGHFEHTAPIARRQPYLLPDDVERDLVESVVKGERPDMVKILDLGVGDLCLFKGRTQLHRVTPVVDGTRCLAVMSYESAPGVKLNAYTREKFYDLNSPLKIATMAGSESKASSPYEYTTDVLIIGSGPAGGAAALALATYGVSHIVITKYRWTANTPRAHITNQRTMEILRDLGIENDVKAQGTPHHLMGDTLLCTSLTGEELGRMRSWLTRPDREGDLVAASPSVNCDVPQTFLEPIILGKAAERGSRILFSTEYVCLQQDDEGVTAKVRDRLSGREYLIRAKYMIGADGGKSKIGPEIGLPYEGQMDLAGNMNVVFEADLTHLVAHRPAVLYWVLQPGVGIGGIGLGLVRMVRMWNQWMVVWGFDINQPPPEVTDEFVSKVVRELVGDDNLPVKILSTSLWSINKKFATRYRAGRVFCAGDAVHRHPPSNGLGSNTSIQDSYNLAWKLALVLRGKAGPGLLDTYDDERAPIGKQIVLRSNKSLEEFGATMVALGVVGAKDEEEMRKGIASRCDDTPEGLQRREALRKALELKDYEFNAHGVEMGHRYTSKAVVVDGTPEPAYTRDPELYYHPTTWPGARLPHVWLLDSGTGRRVSTHDLAGKGRFALFTGISGSKWAEAAMKVSEMLGVDVVPYIIGPGRAYLDVYEDWARAREVEESGCILVRPDAHVGWRSATLGIDPAGKLLEVMAQILDRKV